MKNIRFLSVILAGLMILSACNDDNDSISLKMEPNTEITDVVNRELITTPENSLPMDVEGISVIATDNNDPAAL